MIFFDLAILDFMLLIDALRRPLIIMFMSIINQTFQYTQTLTTALYDESIYELSFDCRHINFEHYLNDKHDNTLRRIFIRDIENNTQIILYNPDELNEQIYVYNPEETFDPIYLYNPEEILGLIDFEVVLPIGLVYNEPLLIFHIEKFKLPGMKYEIVFE